MFHPRFRHRCSVTAGVQKQKYPVLSDMYHVDAQGNYVQELPEDIQEQLNTLIGWQYYILFDQALPAAADSQ